jgi:hypothetical protein
MIYNLRQRFYFIVNFKNSPNSDSTAARNRVTLQLVWGALLVMAGIGVFFRIPQVMPRIEQIGQFSSMMFYIRFCFYILGVLLVGGGAKKIYDNYNRAEEIDSDG